MKGTNFLEDLNNQKKTELEKILFYLNELESKSATNPQLINSKQFFEIWEDSYKPRPFIFHDQVLVIGDQNLHLPKTGKYFVWLSWNPQKKKPDLNFEKDDLKYSFSLVLNEEKIEFSKIETTQLISENKSGEKIEIIYDVIDHLLSQKEEVNIFKLKKIQFLQALEDLKDHYDSKIINNIKKLPVNRIKELISQAASDMAVDDLSSQMSFAFGGSYAFESDIEKESQEGEYIVHSRTFWEIFQDVEHLTLISRYVYDARQSFTLPLTDAEIIESQDLNNIILKINNINDFALKEGCQLNICKTGEQGNIGYFIISLFDYDSVYGVAKMDYKEDLSKLYLTPGKTPKKYLMEKNGEFFELIKNKPENIKGALRSILGFEESKIFKQPKNNDLIEMDSSQKLAFGTALNNDNKVVAVQGPPGTGKTLVLLHIIRHLCMEGKRILFTAPTNTAVDNVVSRIAELPVLRFGNPEKIDPRVLENSWYGNDEGVENFLQKLSNINSGKNSGYIYAATHVRLFMDQYIEKDFSKRGLFDVIVYDEAGMSRLDEFLLCAQFAHRAIIFGDHQQLPPFPISEDVEKKFNKIYKNTWNITRKLINCSALEWINDRGFPLIMLKFSYRCQNPRLLRFSSTMFYQALVKTSKNAEYFKLPYYKRKEKYPSKTLRFYNTGLLPKSKKEEVIVCEGTRIGIENPCEAYLCQKILLKSIMNYSLNEITVISPYKRQVNLIRNLLEFRMVQNQIPKNINEYQWNNFLKSRISTVDSFQGEESDLVIISYVRSNNNKGIGFIDNPNRINVAHTRCRREIIIIGDLGCLKKQEKGKIFKKMERTFSRDGIIYDVDEKKIENFTD